MFERMLGEVAYENLSEPKLQKKSVAATFYPLHAPIAKPL